MNVLLLGPQGSGKGTQAKRIEAEYGIPHIATGDMLRAAMAHGTELGRRVKPIVDSGQLVPDELMIDLIRERLGEPDAEAGFVLDGFPRTSAQADALDAALDEIDRGLSIVFEFQLPEDVAVERLTGRADAEGRSDDTPDVIAHRLRVFRRDTEPVVTYYHSHGILVGIHAERAVDEVFAEIQQALDEIERRVA